MGRSIFIILDFSASKVFTHHWKSIETFCKLLTKESLQFKIFIPKYADSALLTNILNVERALISTDFGPTFREMPLIRIVNVLVKRQLHKLPKDIRHKVRKVLLSIYTRKIRRKIISFTTSHEKVVVLVPSVEPFSVFTFLDLRAKKVPNLEWRLRLIGSQQRGLLSSGNETDLLRAAMRQNPEGVRIGYETFPYRDYLQADGFESTNLYWSPFPSEEIALTEKPKELLKLGFLGSAKERKGFETIPSILSAISHKYSKIEFIIQEAAYPWIGYKMAHQILLANPHVSLLPGELSDKDLTQYISSCDLIILPYEPDSYALAASAILYHAADLHVPVMCPEGVGFAEEIKKYNVGLVYRDFRVYSDFPATIEKILGIKKLDFIRYNEARDSNNKIFLLS